MAIAWGKGNGHHLPDGPSSAPGHWASTANIITSSHNSLRCGWRPVGHARAPGCSGPIERQAGGHMDPAEGPSSPKALPEAIGSVNEVSTRSSSYGSIRR